MPPEITSPRFAHSEGYTPLAFSADGALIITGGTDSLIRVFRSSQSERDKEALTLEHHSDAVVAVAASRSKIVTGDEEGVVLSFDVHDGVHASGTVLRMEMAARDVSISASERLVAVASDDGAVRMVSLVDMGVQHVLEGHRSAVSSAALAPDASFVAAVGCDGTARVWDVRGEATCVQVLRKLAYTCEPGVALQQTKARWSPDGSAFAVAGEGHAVRVVARNSWAVSGELGGEHSAMVTCVAWSGSGRYVASVALDGVVAVWDVQARRAVATRRTGDKLCQVAWNPRANMLAFTDTAGALRVWDGPVPAGQGYAPVFVEAQAAAAAETESEAQVDAAADALMSDLFAGDSMANEDDDSGEPAAFDSGDELADAGEALDDFVVDDDGGGYAERPAAPPRAAPVATRSFQPGATPWAGDRRYLALNMVGSVVSIAQDAAHNTVEITFFDKSAHRDMHFADSFRFALAALCDAGCLLATTTRALANDGSLRGAADSDDASVVAFRAFAPWAAASDWTLPLPPNEHPRCLAVSPAGAAVVTSRGMLRLLTCGGVQRHVESLADRVVTCVAHGDLLLLLLARGAADPGDLEYVLMRMDGGTRLASGTCPLTPASTAAWAGFSEEGHPAVCDSRGVVRLLHRYWAPRQACWVPVLDTRARRAAVWPVALSARHLLAVTCRGASRYPPVPTPILDELPLAVPLLQPDAAASQLEARALEAAVFHEQLAAEAERTAGEYPGGRTAEARDRLEHDKLLLRLVQLACKADRPQRAVDLAAMITSEPSFDACVKIAVHEKQSQLAERLMRLKEARFSHHGDDDEDEDDQDLDSDRDRDQDQASDVEMASDDQRPPPAARRPAATYGSRRAAAGPAAGSAAEAAPAAAAAASAFARPPQPPTTARPFNPFGVVSPSKSMEIKRSHSFFDAADAHSNALSREPSASPADGHVLPPAKRLNPQAADAADAAGAGDAPRKISRTAGAAQSKLTAFAFKRQPPQQAPPPEACSDGPSSDAP